MNTTMIAVAISLTGVIVALVFNMRQDRRADVSAIRTAGIEQGKILSRLDEICAYIADIKDEIAETKRLINEIDKRVSVNEIAIEELRARLDREIKSKQKNSE